MPLPVPSSIPHHANAQELAYATVRAWIVHGPLQPGEVLRDMDIAELLGVSRTPVREALIRLGQEGLVEAARGRGTRVTDLRLDRAPHLFEVGAVLDAHAAEQATPRLTEADLATLWALLAEMEATDDPRRLADLDARLHGVYYARTENPVLQQMLADVDDELTRIERHAWGHGTVRAEANQEHRALVEAFAQRDPQAAARAARQNWSRSWQRITEILDA